MTTDGLPNGPSVPSPNVSPSVVDFINSDMPAPSAVQREVALSMPVYDGPLPEVQIPPQPTSQPAPQPVPQQPQVEQPVPQQPAVQQPTPVQPAIPDVQGQLDALSQQVKQFQSRETAFEAQRQEVETQRAQTQEQAVQNGAKQFAMQEYQKYTAAGVPDETAQQWARNAATSMYNAYSYSNQQQQAQSQSQAIAARHGVNATDIPQGMDSQAMESYANLLSRVNRVETQTQVANTNQIRQQTFDTNQGSPAVNPEQQFFNRVGNTNQLASRQDLAATMQWMKDNEIKGV